MFGVDVAVLLATAVCESIVRSPTPVVPVSPGGVAMQTYQGMPLAASVEEHLHNIQVYGESVYFMPAGHFGHGDETAIPDTPLEEWNAGIDALLKECEGHDGTAL